MSNKQRIIKKAGRLDENEDFTQQSFCERLSLCFVNPTLNTIDLQQERNFVLALARLKIDYEGEDGQIHEQLLRALFLAFNVGSYRGVTGK
jgi:hypothetical protein